jgi:hypothetical protein
MSVGEWFDLVPLSKYYVRKSVLPGPETNLGPILPSPRGVLKPMDSIISEEFPEITPGTVFLIMKAHQIPKERNYENI